jgi:hypothetical protein
MDEDLDEEQRNTWREREKDEERKRVLTSGSVLLFTGLFITEQVALPLSRSISVFIYLEHVTVESHCFLPLLPLSSHHT